MLSKKSISLFNENGYHVKTDNQLITFKRSNFDRYFILSIGFFLMIASLVLAIATPIIGLIVLVISVLVIYNTFKSTAGKLRLTLDLENKQFQYTTPKFGSINKPFEQIDEIGYESVFNNEYSSANKTSTSEYLHKIHISMADQKIPLFLFKQDYLEPSEELQELYNSLKQMFSKNSRTLTA